VRTWHTPAPDAVPPVDEEGRALLVLRALNGAESLALPALGPEGGFVARDLDRAATLLRDRATGARHPVEPRLLDLVFRIETHFGASEVRFLSGYRLPGRRGASNHGRGRALDFVIPGASDADVATYARGLGFVGVGIYPASGFVHLDVRERSYFWSDSSGPGRRNRERGILGDVARASDALAVARGEHGLAPYGFGLDVDAALRAALAHGAPSDEDDDPND
jgi:uncharacterized protein YcbK (DUF882 family)